MRFPLAITQMRFPSTSKCTWCKSHNVSEPHSMAVLSGGAMLMNRKTGDGGPDDRLEGFLDVTWHGAHTNEGGTGKAPDIYKCIEIAQNVQGGQFDINFCSTKCLRSFLNHAVDNLENKIAKKRAQKR